MIQEQSTKMAIISKYTASSLTNLLRLKTSIDIQEYVVSETADNFRSFENDISASNPIKGSGVLATIENIFTTERLDERTFYIRDVNLGSWEITAHVEDFPLKAAAASYMFTLLEIYGDKVAEIMDVVANDQRRSWHERVSADLDFADSNKLKGAKTQFGKPFGSSASDVPDLAIERLVRLKRLRNKYAHRGGRSVDLEDFTMQVCGVMCQIGFMVSGETRFSAYPWDDIDGFFTPKSEQIDLWRGNADW